ncbi:MAG: M14 family zinc carboxypeptidase [Bacteroidota bacterium]
MKTKLLFFVLTFVFATNTFSQKYSRVKVYADEKGLIALSKLGIALEGEIRKGVFVISDFSENEIQLIRKNGFKCEVMIDDVSSYYRNRNLQSPVKSAIKRTSSCGSYPDTYTTPVHFSKGSMGGFYTYNEMLAELDTMAALFPNLITIKQSTTPTTTSEGRTIYWVKISDNPNIDEPEPEILYTALHHAREPQGMQLLIYYMYYLLENYSTNTEIRNLVDNTEMYFIPCVNPDGYVYNQTISPQGGGMWRKNRINNGDGSFGVDLNRNYGYMWGYDDMGSSPIDSMATYRGVSAFSEAETQNVRDFCNAHNFKITLNYHTYSDLLIYPWGYIPSLYTPDSLLFRKYADILTKKNNYVYGTCNEVLGYLVNGESNDWMYGEQTSKNKILSFTSEVGNGYDGFWPDTSRIIYLCNQNMFQNLTAAKLLGKYAVATDIALSPAPFILNKTGYFNFDIQRLGLDSSTFTVSIIPISNISSVGTQKIFTGMNILETRIDSISFTLSPTIQPGQNIKYVLQVNSGLYIYSDTITKIYGRPITVFNDDCTNFTNWSSFTGGWDITNEDYSSSPSSITDSPYSTYLEDSTNSITLNGNIDLTHALSAMLNFYAKWEIEPLYDFVYLSASTDSGATWTQLCGKYTTPKKVSPLLGEPIYEGVQKNWIKEEINLSDFIGHHLKLKFTLVSDMYYSYDGFYFDDMKVLAVFDTLGTNVEISTHSNAYISLPFPNPASNAVSIQYSLNAKPINVTFVLFNAKGQKIYSKQIVEKSGTIKIDTFNWAQGVYYYSITGLNENISFRKMILIK